jgi:hypothetical protein
MFSTLTRRCGTAALAVSTATAAALLAAAPAQADVSISSVSLSTTTIVLDGDAGCGNRAKVTVKVYDPQPTADEVWGVDADVVAPNGDTVDFLSMSYTSRSGDYATYTDWLYVCGWDTPGSYKLHTTVTWWDDSLVDARTAEKWTSFSVKRPSTLTYNASPEPVKRGSALTHSGQLKLDPYSSGAMYGAKGVTVKFYFRAYNWTNYVYKGSAVTGTGGYYSAKIAAWDSGWWKVVYTGDSWRNGQTKWDEVTVTR